MKALVHIAGAYPVVRIIRDIALNHDGVVSPLGFTHTGFVWYGGGVKVVCASSGNAQVWYDLSIPVPQLKKCLGVQG